VGAFLVAVVIANILIFLLTMTIVTILGLGSSLTAMLFATHHLLGGPRGPIPAAPGSRLSVAMWNDIAEILSERR